MRSKELTTRESEVLKLIAEGCSNRLIGVKLGISEHTAKFHVANTLAKLEANSRAEAAAMAVRMGVA